MIDHDLGAFLLSSTCIVKVSTAINFNPPPFFSLTMYRTEYQATLIKRLSGRELLLKLISLPNHF